MKIKACNVASNMSSIIGNATSFLTMYIKNRFPEGFFKDTHISGMLASIESEKKDIVKKSKPTLIIRPEYTGEQGIMQEYPVWFNPHLLVFKNAKRYYSTIFSDPKNGINIYGVPDRVKIDYQIKIVVETNMYAINVLNALKNIFEPNGYFYKDRVAFESEVPKPYIHAIQRYLGLDMNKQEDREKFEEYLLDNSMNAITEKRNLGSGNLEYAYMYNANVLFKMGDTPSKEVSYKERVQDKAIITMDLSLEFTTYSNYLLEVGSNFDPDYIKSESSFDSGFKFDFTIPVNFIKDIRNDGLRLIYRKKFICDANLEVDILPFKGILSDELINVIQNKKYKQDLIDKKMIDIDIYCNGNLVDHSNFEIDWDTFELKINKPKSNVNYYFAFYCNLKELNKISSQERENEQIKTKKNK